MFPPQFRLIVNLSMSMNAIILLTKEIENGIVTMSTGSLT